MARDVDSEDFATTGGAKHDQFVQVIEFGVALGTEADFAAGSKVPTAPLAPLWWDKKAR